MKFTNKNIEDILNAESEGNVMVYEFEGIKFVVSTLRQYQKDTKSTIETKQ